MPAVRVRLGVVRVRGRALRGPGRDRGCLMWCPDDDPMLCAGWVPCTQCREPAYPTAAGWLTGRHIIATYAPGCPHVAEQTRVVDLTTMVVDPRCRGTTRTGTRCRLRARDGDGWCVHHQPQRQHQRGDREGGGRDG